MIGASDSSIRVMIVDKSLRIYRRLLVLFATSSKIKIVSYAQDINSARKIIKSLSCNLMIVYVDEFIDDPQKTWDSFSSDNFPASLVIAKDVDGYSYEDKKDLLNNNIFLLSYFFQLPFKSIVEKFSQLVSDELSQRLQVKNRELHSSKQRKIVGIAASTGGPRIIEQVLKPLPFDYPYPIVIAQHNSEGFTDGLVVWLNNAIPLEVVVAEHNAFLKPGLVYIAPPGKNLTVFRNRIVLSSPEPNQHYRPSCDRLFSSIAAECGQQGVGIVLSGMGNDGAHGLKEIRESGGMTVAQDQNSCVVYGMPGAAVEMGSVIKICSPVEITQLLKKIMDQSSEHEGQLKI